MAVRRIKLGTYNVNNFYDRFDDPYQRGDDFGAPRTTKPKDLMQMYYLGERLREDKPDVLALQEVENKGALAEFNTVQLGKHFDELVVVEGNDPRGIQVGLASVLPLGQVVSYQFLRDFGDPRKGKIFSRDLLEVEVLDPDSYIPVFTAFVSHLKSKFVDPTLKGEKREKAIRDATERRTRQAMAIGQLIKRRFPNPKQGLFVVMGDFNDTPDAETLKPLLADPELGLYDVLSELPEKERWTHYWSDKREYSQLDYILLSQAMRYRMVPGTAKVVQRGNAQGSDHRPVYVDVWVGWNNS